MHTSVETEALRSAALGARGAADGLVAVEARLGQLAPPSEPPLTQAVRILGDACATMVRLVAGNATLAADRLDAAADLYELIDEAIETGFDPRRPAGSVGRPM